jgi:hypothetical protein
VRADGPAAIGAETKTQAATFVIIPALVAGIQRNASAGAAFGWMPGTSPGMMTVRLGTRLLPLQSCKLTLAKADATFIQKKERDAARQAAEARHL